MEKTKNNLKGITAQDMPHNLEAEQALLGCILMDAILQTEVSSQISENDFYSEANKYVFSAMQSLIANNQTVDIVTLSDVMEKLGTLDQAGGIEYISNLTNVLPSSANYQKYLDIVLRDSLLRKLIKGSAEIIDNCKTSTDKISALAYAEKTVYDISNTADTSSMVKIGSVIPDVLTKFDELSKDKSSLKGIKMGFKGLDYLLNGLHKSDLIILAARPAVGKTSLAMNIVENVALQGKTCAVFSLEMGKEQLVQRMMCSVAGVSMESALKGTMSKSEWMKIGRARQLLADAKIFIDDSAAVTPRELISKCRRLDRKEKLDLVMVDYIQLMSSDSRRREENRQQEISEISRNLKILAKEINVPVIALSQLSRAVETRKGRPQLADLRESGAIEQDADIVMFIHRPDKGATDKELQEGKVKKNVAEIIVEKHRNGPTGIVELYFKGECTKFVNINNETGEPEGENEKPSQNRLEGINSVKELNNSGEQTSDTENRDKNDNQDKNVDEEIFI